MIKITEFTKGESKYFYTTEEVVKICPICKSEYKRRKFCLKCWKEKGVMNPTESYTKERNGWVSRDLSKFCCSCIFGSWFRWAGFWKENHPNSICKHALLAIRRIKKDEKRNSVDDCIGIDGIIPLP